jgi:hypothetical protein
MAQLILSNKQLVKHNNATQKSTTVFGQRKCTTYKTRILSFNPKSQIVQNRSFGYLIYSHTHALQIEALGTHTHKPSYSVISVEQYLQMLQQRVRVTGNSLVISTKLKYKQKLKKKMRGIEENEVGLTHT